MRTLEYEQLLLLLLLPPNTTIVNYNDTNTNTTIDGAEQSVYVVFPPLPHPPKHTPTTTTTTFAILLLPLLSLPLLSDVEQIRDKEARIRKEDYHITILLILILPSFY